MEPWTQSKDYPGSREPNKDQTPQGPNPMNVANGRLLINLQLERGAVTPREPETNTRPITEDENIVVRRSME